MQVSFNKYPSEYDFAKRRIYTTEHTTHTISATKHTIKYLEGTGILKYIWYLSLMCNYSFRKFREKMLF